MYCRSKGYSSGGKNRTFGKLVKCRLYESDDPPNPAQRRWRPYIKYYLGKRSIINRPHGGGEKRAVVIESSGGKAHAYTSEDMKN